MGFSVIELGIFAVVVGVLVFNVRKQLRAKRETAAGKARSEALFVSMFPELQPYFHPVKAIEYVHHRRQQSPQPGRQRVKGPPGFGVDAADIELSDGTERVTLLDAAGATLSQFVYQDNAEGGVLRIGKGKMTVTLPADGGGARVRYWHPDREFKWKKGVWTFQSRLADREIESSSDHTSFSDSSSSSSSSSSTSDIARGAAVAGGIAAAGGAFDGGGASASFDGAEGSASSAPAY